MIIASQKFPYVKFAFGVLEPVDSYGSDKQLLGTSFDKDTVPPGTDPVTYLRERVMAELDRITLGQGAAPKKAVVVLPGYEPKAPEAEED